MPLDDDAGADAPEAVEVWDVHWEAFCIFRACATQWRSVALQNGLLSLGLDYQGVDVVMRRLLPAGADLGRVFADVQVMEAEALPILNEVPA